MEREFFGASEAGAAKASSEDLRPEETVTAKELALLSKNASNCGVGGRSWRVSDPEKEEGSAVRLERERDNVPEVDPAAITTDAAGEMGLVPVYDASLTITSQLTVMATGRAAERSTGIDAVGFELLRVTVEVLPRESVVVMEPERQVDSHTMVDVLQAEPGPRENRLPPDEQKISAPPFPALLEEN